MEWLAPLRSTSVWGNVAGCIFSAKQMTVSPHGAAEMASKLPLCLGHCQGPLAEKSGDRPVGTATSSCDKAKILIVKCSSSNRSS